MTTRETEQRLTELFVLASVLYFRIAGQGRSCGLKSRVSDTLGDLLVTLVSCIDRRPGGDDAPSVDLFVVFDDLHEGLYDFIHTVEYGIDHETRRRLETLVVELAALANRRDMSRTTDGLGG